MTTYRKKLIEVALPLDAINAASAREKAIRQGHPSTLHLWWARRPLAAARAVIFAQMVDDPSAHPDLFPTEKKQEKERERLFKIIEDLVKWENSTNEEVLERARTEIWQSWRRTCAEYADHPRAKELFDRHKLPAFHDPFAGGGALPLEAQRLGLESHATDLNPVAVLINKAMIEIPPKFAGRPPVNPESREDPSLLSERWRGAQGLAADIRYYGRWMRDEAEKRIGHLYPKVKVTAEMAADRPDLKPHVGTQLTVIAWIWARTVKSPNPAFSGHSVPLASTFTLSTKTGKETYIEPLIDAKGYRFTVRVGLLDSSPTARSGTKLARGANFRCLLSGTPISGDYIKSEAIAGRMGARMMAVAVDGPRGRLYLPPTPEMETLAESATPPWQLEGELAKDIRAFTTLLYGMTRWSDLFTGRQLTALTTLANLAREVRAQIARDAECTRHVTSDDDRPLAAGGTGPRAYADAVGVYLAFGLSKQADLANNLCTWEPIAQCPRHLFGRQAIPIVWDFAEGNPLGNSSGAWSVCVEGLAGALEKAFPMEIGVGVGSAHQADAGTQDTSRSKVVSTDPPYYDNVGYSDLSDFFYVWHRNALADVFPDLFQTVATPKTTELIASPYRHGDKRRANDFFLSGMTEAMRRISLQAHDAFPVSIYYAFKQSEGDSVAGVASTGWETFLDAVIRADLSVTGTWPVRTENSSRLRGQTSNALASSIVLVCRPRLKTAKTVSRRDFITALRAELPAALAHLQHSNIAPVDLAQAAIGPGMAVYSQYARVLDADGSALTIRDALALINNTLDESLASQEGDFDVDSRWALAWFDEHGFDEGPYGIAETLSKAKNTSVDGMLEAGILTSRAGKVRLLAPDELPSAWDPEEDRRVDIWEMLHHLIRVFEHAGETSASQLLAKYGSKADVVRELAYRLYTACERRKRAKEAGSYNALVQSWPEIARLAKEGQAPAAPKQVTGLFDQE
jgi:putative DNA methylase